MGVFVGKSPAARKNGAPVGPVEPDELASLFPALWEYLTVQSWEDGTSREVATIMLFCEASQWKAWLNDRAEGRSAWASGSTAAGALYSLEGALVAGTADWRARPAGGGRSGKRA